MMFDYTGIFRPYSQIGQYIDQVEDQEQLLQTQLAMVEPLEFRSTIQFNSTYVLTVGYIGLQYHIVKTKMEPIQKAIKISPWGIEPDSKNINQQNLNFQQLLKQLA